MELEKVYEQKEEFIDYPPEVYLLLYLREDIINYVDNPYQYLVKMKFKLYNTLLDEYKSPLSKNIRILDVLIKPDNGIDKSYIIYKHKEEVYPNLDSWWEYLPLDKKAEIYLNHK